MRLLYNMTFVVGLKMQTLMEKSNITQRLADLEKGMNGQLNMTAAMEDLAQALSIDQVPGRNPFHAISWEKLAWPSKKGLMPWFADLQVILLASDASVFH